MTEEPAESSAPDTRRLACHVLCAYLRHNTMPTSEVPTALRAIHRAFETIAAPAPPVHLAPAVPIKKSVTRDYLICLEDGRKLKMLKRYLRTKFGMTPEEYRAKWHLPQSYPMTAPTYAAKRSELAKKAGLGDPRRYR